MYMEINNNFKLYYIIPAAVLIIIVAVVLLLPKKTAPPQTSPTPPAQMPTLIPTLSYSQPTGAPPGQVKQNVTPTLIPVDYTGAIENQRLPQAEEDLANQKSTLRKKLPLAQPAFIITFDYANDQFLVTLNEPKQTSKTLFIQWLQTNYPAIPIDRFTFK